MPKAWSDKDERQYEHVKECARKQGKSAKRARRLGIEGRSRMSKGELVSAVRRAE